MERLHITHIVYSYLPVTQNWIYTQIRSTSSCDHSVISLIEENPDQFQWNNRRVAFRENTLFSLYRLLFARYWIKQPDRFFHTAIQSLHPEVIHGHFSTEAWRVLPHAKSASIPLVTTFYGLDVDKLSRRAYWKKRYPILFTYGSAFIVEGPFMGMRLATIGCSNEKLHIIPLGVDPDLYTATSKERHTGEETVTVLFVGCNREKKGAIDAARIFIAAAKMCPHLRLLVVGNGKYRKHIEKMIHSTGMRSRVEFHGSCTFAAYRMLLKASDIILVPSCFARDGDSEGGAPVVCIEAQIAGIPVIGTQHCDIPYVVHHGKGGMLSPEHDIDSMARDLILLTQNPSLRLQMGQYGQKLALQRHDIKKQAKELEKIYQSVVVNASERLNRT